MCTVLPTRDQYTTYNYSAGEERRRSVEENQIRFEQKDKSLVVFLNEKRLTSVRYLPPQVTANFATTSMNKWGEKQFERVLSSTETGALYWNIIYHYEKFESIAEVCRNINEVALTHITGKRKRNHHENDPTGSNKHERKEVTTITEGVRQIEIKEDDEWILV